MREKSQTFWPMAGAALCGGAGMVLARTPHFVRLLEFSPRIQLIVETSWQVMLFSGPWIILRTALGPARGEFVVVNPRAARLKYVEPKDRDQLYLVLGEVAGEDRWLQVDEDALPTGMAVIGASGSGKTSGLMYPALAQILGTWARDERRKVGGLILEVKGDMCREAKRALEAAGRRGDYIGLSLGGPWVYNPLMAEDADPYDVASSVASFIVNTYGKGLEPFWQLAYMNLIKFIIILYLLADGYVTLRDVYLTIVRLELIEDKLAKASRRILGERFLMFTKEVYKPRSKTLQGKGVVWDEELQRYVAPSSPQLEHYVEQKSVPYEVKPGVAAAPINFRELHLLSAVNTWYHEDYLHDEPRLRQGIAKSITSVLSLFDSNPELFETFCPSKARWDSGDHVVKSFRELIESGKVVGLETPLTVSRGVARLLSVMTKLDYESAVLARTERMALHPEAYYRHTLLMVDEYQFIATAGQGEPAGDDMFFSLSRQARCIPIIAMQSISSLRSVLPGDAWRSVLQLFRTKVFLTQTDDASAEIASRLCGTEEVLKPTFSFSEAGQDARFAVDSTLRMRRASVSVSKTLVAHEEPRVKLNDLMELPSFTAIVLTVCGDQPLPPVRCKLRRPVWARSEQ